MENKRRIVIFDPLSHIAGGQRVLLNLIPFLIKDFLIIVVLPQKGPLGDKLSEMGVKVIIINSGSYSLVKKNTIQVMKYLVYLPVFLIKTFFIIKENDLIYVNGARLLPMIVVANFLNKKPIIFHNHSLISDKKSLFLVEFFAKNKKVKKIISVSSSIISKNILLKNKTELMHNGVDLKKFYFENKFFKKRYLNIIVIGDLIPTKGQDLLIKALSKNIGFDFRLKLVGSARGEDEDYFLRLKELVKTNLLDDRVDFMGRRENINNLLRESDLLILPSISHEGCPMVALEAMACGVPVIASDLGGTKEIVKNGYSGYIFKSGNEKDLISKINLFFNLSLEKTIEMKKNCRLETKLKYSLENNAHKIKQIINDIIK